MITDLLPTQSIERNKITPTLMDIQQSNKHIEDYVDFLTSQNEEQKKKIEHLDEQAKKDRKYILLLEHILEDMQRDSRKTSH